MIYADGSVYTNRLRAEGGYVKNMAIGNCTIAQDCVVKGTVYAERIEGDVVRIHAMHDDTPVKIAASGRSRLATLAITVCSGTSWTQCDVYLNGSVVHSVKSTVIATAGGASISSYTAMETYSVSIPAGQTYSIKFVKSAGNAESYNFPGAVGVLMIDAQI